MGVWEAKTSAGALLKFHRARGFGPDEVWIEDGKLCFKDGDWEDFMGPPGSWIVQTVGRAGD